MVEVRGLYRYQRLILIPGFLIIFMGVASASGLSGEDSAALLLAERTAILQAAYYGEKALEEAEELLAQIETHPLLTEDITLLREGYSAGTEMDRVAGMELISLERKSKLYEYVTYSAVILWDMQGLEGSYRQEIRYHIVLKSDGRTWRLSEMEAV